MSKKVSRKSRAGELASHGWAVVPVYAAKNGRCSCHQKADCKRPGKHPCAEHGVKDATADTKQIDAWWTQYPFANIGVATGSKSKIIVLDIDPRNGGAETLKRLAAELGPLPDTITSDTGGGGQHLVFEYPDFDVRKDSAGKVFGPGVDVLSNGSLIVAPPSWHETGKRYSWEEGKSPRDLPAAQLPQAWLDRLRDRDHEHSVHDGEASTDAILEGERNTSLTRLAGKLHRDRLSSDAISAALHAENRQKCSPPLDNAEVDKIVASITTRYTNGGTAGGHVDSGQGQE
ncbi:MAG: bifunctional DNA primase/polymerase [Xanthobacteraceae bacterium]